MLHTLACPNCGAPGLEAQQPSGLVVCKFCGNQFANDDRVACPRCEAINPADSSFCKECGEKLKRHCSACGSENWAGAAYCAKCGRNLDTIEGLAQRHATGYKGTLQQQRDSANRLKVQEEVASQRRLDTLWETEKRRQEFLAQQQAERNRQQTTIVLVIIAVGAVIFMGVIGLALFGLLK
jgi:uncharacterized Zn finger protein (UPF0148 family)